MAPLPKPSKLAERDGTHKSRIKYTLQDRVEPGVPLRPPHHRCKNATKFWSWITHQLGEEGMNILTDHDQKILEIATSTYKAMRDCEERCVKDGRTVEFYNDEGELIACKRAPWDIAYRDYSMQLSKLLGDLALTPTARARYAIPESEKTGDIEEDTRRMIKKFEPIDNVG